MNENANENLEEALEWQKSKNFALEERLVQKEGILSQMRKINNELCEDFEKLQEELESLRKTRDQYSIEIETLKRELEKGSFEDDQNNEEKELLSEKTRYFYEQCEILYKENDEIRVLNERMKLELDKKESSKESTFNSKEKELEMKREYGGLSIELEELLLENEQLNKKCIKLQEQIEIDSEEKTILMKKVNQNDYGYIDDISKSLEKLERLKTQAFRKSEVELKKKEKELENLKSENRCLKQNNRGI